MLYFLFMLKFCKSFVNNKNKNVYFFMIFLVGSNVSMKEFSVIRIMEYIMEVLCFFLFFNLLKNKFFKGRMKNFSIKIKKVEISVKVGLLVWVNFLVK